MIEKTSAGMNQGMINKLITVLEATLSKLSRYDEGSLIGSILSLTVLHLMIIWRRIEMLQEESKCDNTFGELSENIFIIDISRFVF